MTVTAWPAAPRTAPSALVLLAWVFAFILVGGTTVLGWHPVARAVGVAVFGLPVVVWAITRFRRPLEALDIAILVGIVAHLAVSVVSRDRTSAMEMSGAVVGYAAFFWLARHLGRNANLQSVTATAVTIALLFWLIVFAMTWIGEQMTVVRLFGWPPTLEARQAWVWGSVNTPPILALLAGPFIAWLPPGSFRRVSVAAWLAASVVVVPLSLGRAGWLGIGVAVLALEVMLGFPASRRIAAMVPAAWRGGAAIAAVLVAGAIAVLGLTRIEAVAAELDSRSRLWAQALALFAEDPITGSGPSTYPWARLAHVPDYVDRVAAKDAHSVPLQTLGDGGLVLGVAALAIVVVWAATLVSRRRSLTIPQRCSIAALTGYAAFSLLDDLAYLPAVTVLIIILAAWSIPAATRPGVGGSGPRGLVAPAILLAASLAVLPFLGSMTAARVHAATGNDAAVGGAWAGAREAFERAAGAHPENAQLWMSIGLAAAREGDRPAAVGAYERAREISPGDPRPWGALAALEPDPGRAAVLLADAARRSNDGRYAFRLGTTLERLGDAGGAARAYALAVTLEPRWISAVPNTLWAPVQELLPDAVATIGSVAGRDPREVLWDASLRSGVVDEGAPTAWRAVGAAVAGDRSAADGLLARAAIEEPHEPHTDAAAVAVARLFCDGAAYLRAESRLANRNVPSPAGDHPVRIGRAGHYREPLLGDYQPIEGRSVPEVPPWPLGLIEVPDCDW